MAARLQGNVRRRPPCLFTCSSQRQNFSMWLTGAPVKSFANDRTFCSYHYTAYPWIWLRGKQASACQFKRSSHMALIISREYGVTHYLTVQPSNASTNTGLHI